MSLQGRQATRLSILALGLVAILVALLADRLGLDSSGSFGRGQVLVLTGGVLLLLCGALWKHVPAAYRTTAILFLNTLVLVFLIELGALVLSTQGAKQASNSIRPPYYAQQEWSVTYWREHGAANRKQYHPYTMWRRRPFDGQTINVDANGFRKTPGTCTEPSYTVFAFGGSALWGWGSPDSLTIPGYLQRQLRTPATASTCVSNFGEDAYISTQEIMELMQQLQRGKIPDLVVFYHGVNDAINALTAGRAGIYLGEESIRAKLEHGPARLLLAESEAAAALQRLNSRDGLYDTRDLEQLADEVVSVYLENCRIAIGLANEYGFEVAFFWQPVICVGEKTLTDAEQTIRDRMDETVIRFYQSVYARIEREAADNDALHYLAGVFDDEPTQVWMDPLHVTPVGNQLAAKMIVESIGMGQED
jgi:lysophospholipase L1-like esterase